MQHSPNTALTGRGSLSIRGVVDVFQWMAEAVREAEKRYCFTFNPPVAEEVVAEIETALALRLPSALRRFLIEHHDGGILFHTQSDQYSPTSFHVYSVSTYGRQVPYRILEETLAFREANGKDADGLVIFGYTPGPGAFQLAVDTNTGEVLDLYGFKRADWPVIASDFEELLRTMFKNLENPLYWL